MLKFFRNKMGQSATEYMLVLGLIVALIFIVGRLLQSRFPDVVDAAINRVVGGIESVGEGQ